MPIPLVARVLATAGTGLCRDQCCDGVRSRRSIQPPEPSNKTQGKPPSVDRRVGATRRAEHPAPPLAPRRLAAAARRCCNACLDFQSCARTHAVRRRPPRSRKKAGRSVETPSIGMSPAAARHGWHGNRQVGAAELRRAEGSAELRPDALGRRDCLGARHIAGELRGRVCPHPLTRRTSPPRSAGASPAAPWRRPSKPRPAPLRRRRARGERRASPQPRPRLRPSRKRDPQAAR